jgi:hypothetical protein
LSTIRCHTRYFLNVHSDMLQIAQKAIQMRITKSEQKSNLHLSITDHSVMRFIFLDECLCFYHWWVVFVYTFVVLSLDRCVVFCLISFRCALLFLFIQRTVIFEGSAWEKELLQSNQATFTRITQGTNNNFETVQSIMFISSVKQVA